MLELVRSSAPRTIVEIGTAGGGTFYGLCQSAPDDALIVSIDMPGGDFGGGYDEDRIEKMRGYARKRQSLHFLRSDSHAETTKQELLGFLAGRPIDFLFIDGDHTYQGVKSDYEMYAPLVAPAGIVGFHDIVEHPAATGCEVERFWNEIKPESGYTEFVDLADDWGWGPWGGIGVLHARAS